MPSSSDAVRVTACLVTRGNVDMRPVVESLPKAWEVVTYDNSRGVHRIGPHGHGESVWLNAGELDLGLHSDVPGRLEDMAVYGRYEAINYARGDLIYVQDDDVIVSNPEELLEYWLDIEALHQAEHSTDPRGFLVANMPPEFRHEFYTDNVLVGFGAVFPRELPDVAFSRFLEHYPDLPAGVFDRTCDIVFTALTPHFPVDVPKVDREFASDADRMWRQPEHVGERLRVRGYVADIRDAVEADA